MSLSDYTSWRGLFKDYLATARISILNQFLEDSDLGIQPESVILMSNVDTAAILLQWHSATNKTSHGLPETLIVRELAETTNIDDIDAQLRPAIRSVPTVELKHHRASHAIMRIHTDRTEGELLDLLQQFNDSLAPDSKLILWQRNRDGLAEIFHAAGLQVPGGLGTSGGSVYESRLCHGLRSTVEKSGFYTQVQECEYSYVAYQTHPQHLTDELKRLFSASLGECEEHKGWEQRLGHAVSKEVAAYTGVSLTAAVVTATKTK